MVKKSEQMRVPGSVSVIHAITALSAMVSALTLLWLSVAMALVSAVMMAGLGSTASSRVVLDIRLAVQDMESVAREADASVFLVGVAGTVAMPCAQGTVTREVSVTEQVQSQCAFVKTITLAMHVNMSVSMVESQEVIARVIHATMDSTAARCVVVLATALSMAPVTVGLMVGEEDFVMSLAARVKTR